MSTVFTLAPNPPRAWRVTCDCAGAYEEFTAVDAAIVRAHDGTRLRGCRDDLCAPFGMNVASAPDVAPVSIEVNDAVAAHLLDVLGLGEDGPDGVIDPVDFMGRVLLAQALVPANADALVGAGTGNGQPKLMASLMALHGIAEHGVRSSREVTWQ